MEHAASMQRRIDALSLIIAPLLLATSTFFWNGVEVGLTGGTIQVICALFLILAFQALLRLTRSRFPALSTWGAIPIYLACIGANNWGMDGVFAATYGALGATPEMRAALLDQMGAAAVLTLFLPGLLFPLSMFTVGVMLTRIPSVPRWSAILLCIGAVAFPASRVPRIELLAHTADLFLLIPLALIGLGIVNGSIVPGADHIATDDRLREAHAVS